MKGRDNRNTCQLRHDAAVCVHGKFVGMQKTYLSLSNQLDTFIGGSPKKGAVLRTGLWKYTRHPNYFGEVAMWWGLWLIVLPLHLGFVAIVSPLAITLLILEVSGIPLLEKRYEKNVAYQDYKKVTSAFFPLPPRKITK